MIEASDGKPAGAVNRRGWGLVAYRRLEPEIWRLQAEGHTLRMIYDLKGRQLPVSYPQFVKLVRRHATGQKPTTASPTTSVSGSTERSPIMRQVEKPKRITGTAGKREEDYF